LHLLGYDHEKSDKEARRMYRLQDSIFDQLTTAKAFRRTQAHGNGDRTLRRKK
jgi:ssRNA-specific RNase YbeY (16S rRNA maturation enzyme)